MLGPLGGNGTLDYRAAALLLAYHKIPVVLLVLAHKVLHLGIYMHTKVSNAFLHVSFFLSLLLHGISDILNPMSLIPADFFTQTDQAFFLSH